MSDDAFHLTPSDVRAQEFQRVFRGYDPAQVEEFKTGSPMSWSVWSGSG